MKFYAEFISRKRKRKNIPKYSEFKEARYFKLQTGQKNKYIIELRRTANADLRFFCLNFGHLKPVFCRSKQIFGKNTHANKLEL